MKLKPCPFCGGEAKKVAVPHTGFYYYAVMCKDCQATGRAHVNIRPRLRDEENPAIEAWNMRTEVTEDEQ